MVEPSELAELGMTIDHLARAIEGSDSKQVAGRLLQEEALTSIEVRGEFDSVARIKQLPVQSGSSDILLGDIASVSKTYLQPEENITRLDGERVILVASRIEVSSQIRPWTSAVQAELRQLEDEIGGLVALQEVFEQAAYTEERLQTLGQNLMAGYAGCIDCCLGVYGLALRHHRGNLFATGCGMRLVCFARVGFANPANVHVWHDHRDRLID